MGKKTVIGFYGENDENGYMSNWYRAGFDLGGRHFFCNEQYMMYRKAEVFEDKEAMRFWQNALRQTEYGV